MKIPIRSCKDRAILKDVPGGLRITYRHVPKLDDWKFSLHFLLMCILVTPAKGVKDLCLYSLLLRNALCLS